MTRTTPQLVPPLKTSTPHQREGVWPLRDELACTGPIHGGSSVDSGFEPKFDEGRGGLVVRSQPRVAGSKPDSTENPPCMGPVAR
ncbi:hypothetical protein AVEN_185289-1 [Araneus ventricosus]|uniref:Uncharacterized protein n=1 Tax=Araneus ventricosus TaxID=182803 RepID=A0A4Y2KU88_ARAVE|nr:hypothetical protein AVEN_185289-1 [Araneus ventricosus]